MHVIDHPRRSEIRDRLLMLERRPRRASPNPWALWLGLAVVFVWLLALVLFLITINLPPARPFP